MANKKFNNPKDQQIHDALQIAYEALSEKKYEPINQLTGFILSSDPCYITPHNGAREKMSALDSDDILKHLLKNYFET